MGIISEKKVKLNWIIVSIQSFVAIVVLALIFLVFSLQYKNSKEFICTSAQEAMHETAVNLEGFLAKGIGVIHGTGGIVEFMIESGETKEHIRELLQHQTEKYVGSVDSEFTGIYGVIDDAFVDGLGWNPGMGFEVRQRPWYKIAQKGNGNISMTDPYVDSMTGDIIFSIASLLSDGESIISLDVKLNKLQAISREKVRNGPGIGFIMGADGTVIAHSWFDERGKNYLSDTSEDGTSWRHEIAELLKEQPLVRKEIIIKNEKVLLLSEQLFNGWKVVRLVTENDLLKYMRKGVIMNSLVVFLVIAMAVVFAVMGYINWKRAVKLSGMLKRFRGFLENKLSRQSEKIKEQTRSLLLMQETVIEGMASLIEYRDVNTGKHVKNTKKYVLLIANYIYEHKLHPEEVDKNYVWMLGNAAALHDVGKIAITDSILNKPGVLSEYEYEVMKTHTMIGGAIVRNIFAHGMDKKMVGICSEVAQYHHERWDGKGYPIGLSGSDIPLSARIMAIADVFDALVSERIYKEPLPVERVFDEIERESGSHFDPELVDIFLFLKREILIYLRSEEGKK